MGVLADSVLTAGGEAIGVMPKALVEKEIAHGRLTRLHVVESMHERKALMADLADAFVLLPADSEAGKSSARSSPGCNSESTGSPAEF